MKALPRPFSILILLGLAIFFSFTHISFNGGFVSHYEVKIVIGNPDTFSLFVI